MTECQQKNKTKSCIGKIFIFIRKKLQIVTKIYIYSNHMKDNLHHALEHIILLSYSPLKARRIQQNPSRGCFSSVLTLHFSLIESM